MIRFLKNWTMPVAMIAGALGYFIFHKVQFLGPLKPAVWAFVQVITPVLIFMQLFLTFCKVKMSAMRLTRWSLLLLLFQLLSAGAAAAILMYVPMNEVYREIFEGAMVCLICPTATAAAVVTDKLGGSAARVTVYTLMSNILAAVFVPIVFPLVELHPEVGFWQAFLIILWKVFTLLICPFLLALFLKFCWPAAHDFFRDHAGISFYLWGFALALVVGQTVRSLHNSTAPASVMWMIAAVSMVCCALQFFVGKKAGLRAGDSISSGQALGQKNTVLAIWMAYTYLNPLSSLAPGTYVIWQNVFNSWQLWQKRRRESRTEDI